MLITTTLRCYYFSSLLMHNMIISVFLIINHVCSITNLMGINPACNSKFMFVININWKCSLLILAGNIKLIFLSEKKNN